MDMSCLLSAAKTFARYWMMLAVLTLINPAASFAATVFGGALTINLDRDALAAAIDLDATPAPAMYVEEFFNAEASAVRTYTQILEDHLVPGAGEISASGLTFSVNGTSVNNLLGRRSKATTLNFDPNDFQGSVIGQIGLAGVTRFRIDTGQEHNRILSGDYTLEYNAANIDTDSGRSGWSLYNHVSFRSQSYNLFNVAMMLDSVTLALTGNLALGDGYGHLNGNIGAVVGTFSFQTAVVPVPGVVWLFVSGLAWIGVSGRVKDKYV